MSFKTASTRIKVVIKRCLLAIAFLIFSCANFLSAHELPPLLTFGTGIYGPTSSHPRFLFQLEHKWSVPKTRLRPLMGLLTGEFDSVFVYGGIGLDVFFKPYVVVTPNFAPGVYFRGKGKNLGHPIEFRSCIEFAYLFPNQSRFGIEFFHLSNASISKKNPGINAVALFFSIPLRTRSRSELEVISSQ